MNKKHLSRLNRIVAVLLSIVWLGLGCTGVALGIIYKLWALVLAGLLSVWWGLIWVRVAIKGYRLPWPAGLIPWRRE